MSSREKSPYYGALQQVVDSLFADLTEEERIAILGKNARALLNI